MNKKFFPKQLFTVVSAFLLTATLQVFVAQAQPRTANKLGRENVAVAGSSTVKTNPRLSAERNNYAPGESAAITGQGFDKFEQITVSVEQIDDLQKTGNLLTAWTVVADENGSVNFDWNASFSGNYIVKAVGGTTKQETQTFLVVARTVAQVPGNPNCKDLGANFEEFKIDPPRSGTYQFAGNNSVTANFYGGEDGLTYVDFQSTLSFAAVIVKGGRDGANIYSYSPKQATDTGLSVPNLQDISHVSFCYEPSAIPTAASAAVSGFVRNAKGRGLARSTVTIQNLNTEETRTVITNSFGRYRFNDLPVGNIYSITISSKRAGFTEQTRSFVLNGDEENVDFTATAR